MSRTYPLLLALALLAACRTAPPEQPLSEATERAVMHQSVQALTDVMVHDIFSPPQAARAYAYPLVAYYEAYRDPQSGYASYAGQLNGLGALPQKPEGRISPLVAGTHAFLRTADAFVFSQDRFSEDADAIRARLQALHLPADVYARSVTYGDAVADAVLAWMKTDGYAESRTRTRYATQDGAGQWRPTPPAYMEPVEPFWGTLRPFALDSAGQVAIAPPPPFDLTAGSDFYGDMMEVYTVQKTLTDEQRAITAFWDCNPFVVHAQGHLSYGAKKISPGGHWMGITATITEAHADAPVQTLATYSQVALVLSDAFVASWEEKYRSNLIRPETVIRDAVDPLWQPVLQTPPFPEYPSGHSVISTAAATVLTSIYGPDVAFVDTSEVRFGLPSRSFTSFYDASEEAAISRLYGGIHYRPAIEKGIEMGRHVGEIATSRIALRPEGLAAQ